MNRQGYNVAGFVFSVVLPEGADAGRLLPSFVPFAVEEYDDRMELFRMDAVRSLPSFWPGETGIEDMTSDMGHVSLSRTSDCYIVRLRVTDSSPVHVMAMSADFASAQANIDWNDRNVPAVLASLLRIMYSQAILLHGGVAVHASVISDGERAYMFMGKSGTGKSTHSSLWLEYVGGTSLVNDDNPVVRTVDEAFMVYGTPWSGKTPCYRNVKYPLGGAVRLVQAEENRFIRKQDTDAFSVLLPGCSVIKADARLFDRLCETLSGLAVSVPVGVLECRPDREAVAICRAALENAGGNPSSAGVWINME